ncbi:hypothetical protein EIN_249480, partial [Entamoeba invadens IP1]
DVLKEKKRIVEILKSNEIMKDKKIGIHKNIIRYFLLIHGDEKLFEEYCFLSEDVEGYIERQVVLRQYTNVYNTLSALLEGRSEFFQEKGDKSVQCRIGQKMLEKFFNVLFCGDRSGVLSFLQDVEFALFPSLFTALSTIENEDSMTFSLNLLTKIEERGGFDEKLCLYVFWELLRKSDDKTLLQFLQKNEMHMEGVVSLPPKGVFVNHKRSYLYIMTQKAMTEEMIQTGIELILEEGSAKDAENCLLWCNTLDQTIKDQINGLTLKDVYTQIVMKSAIQVLPQNIIIDLVKNFKIPISLVIDILPETWESTNIVEMLTEAIVVHGKEVSKMMGEIEKTIEISQSSYEFSKEMFLVGEYCDLCKKRVIESDCVVFGCGHTFHVICIKNEFIKNKTQYAQVHKDSVDDECPLCGIHQIDLISLPYDKDARDWEL